MIRVCRFRAARSCLATTLAAFVLLAPTSPADALAASLRFHGNGVNDIDRVKIAIDDPANANPGPPADIGAADFTIEFWMRASAEENGAGAVSCGANIAWINGNIAIDRDRYNQDRKFGLSIAGGRVVFGVSGDGTGDRTICGTTVVLDAAWHYVAVERRRSDGFLWLYVDGTLEASADGPDGDVSYPDDGVPGDFCGGPCTNSDPFLVFGAEKHDAGSSYPSYSGWLDEVRLSSVLRYAADFTSPQQPFAPDAGTAALYHFDEGIGNAIGDASGTAGGPSDGVRQFGGTPAGPEWSTETPFAPTGVGASVGASAGSDAGAGASGRGGSVSLVAAPSPFRGRTVITARSADGAPIRADAALAILDASGRRVATLRGRATAAGGLDFEWAPRAGGARMGGVHAGGALSPGPALAPGVYFARLAAGGAPATARIILR